jgi:hypothetical protein
MTKPTAIPPSAKSPEQEYSNTLSGLLNASLANAALQRSFKNQRSGTQRVVNTLFAVLNSTPLVGDAIEGASGIIKELSEKLAEGLDKAESLGLDQEDIVDKVKDRIADVLLESAEDTFEDKVVEEIEEKAEDPKHFKEKSAKSKKGNIATLNPTNDTNVLNDFTRDAVSTIVKEKTAHLANLSPKQAREEAENDFKVLEKVASVGKFAKLNMEYDKDELIEKFVENIGGKPAQTLGNSAPVAPPANGLSTRETVRKRINDNLDPNQQLNPKQFESALTFHSEIRKNLNTLFSLAQLHGQFEAKSDTIDTVISMVTSAGSIAGSALELGGAVKLIGTAIGDITKAIKSNIKAGDYEHVKALNPDGDQIKWNKFVREFADQATFNNLEKIKDLSKEDAKKEAGDFSKKINKSLFNNEFKGLEIGDNSPEILKKLHEVTGTTIAPRNSAVTLNPAQPQPSSEKSSSRLTTKIELAETLNLSSEQATNAARYQYEIESSLKALGATATAAQQFNPQPGAASIGTKYLQLGLAAIPLFGKIAKAPAVALNEATNFAEQKSFLNAMAEVRNLNPDGSHKAWCEFSKEVASRMTTEKMNIGLSNANEKDAKKMAENDFNNIAKLISDGLLAGKTINENREEISTRFSQETNEDLMNVAKAAVTLSRNSDANFFTKAWRKIAGESKENKAAIDKAVLSTYTALQGSFGNDIHGLKLALGQDPDLKLKGDLQENPLIHKIAESIATKASSKPGLLGFFSAKEIEVKVEGDKITQLVNSVKPETRKKPEPSKSTALEIDVEEKHTEAPPPVMPIEDRKLLAELTSTLSRSLQPQLNLNSNRSETFEKIETIWQEHSKDIAKTPETERGEKYEVAINRMNAAMFTRNAQGELVHEDHGDTINIFSDLFKYACADHFSHPLAANEEQQKHREVLFQFYGDITKSFDFLKEAPGKTAEEEIKNVSEAFANLEKAGAILDKSSGVSNFSSVVQTAREEFVKEVLHPEEQRNGDLRLKADKETVAKFFPKEVQQLEGVAEVRETKSRRSSIPEEHHWAQEVRARENNAHGTSGAVHD